MAVDTLLLVAELVSSSVVQSWLILLLIGLFNSWQLVLLGRLVLNGWGMILGANVSGLLTWSNCGVDLCVDRVGDLAYTGHWVLNGVRLLNAIVLFNSLVDGHVLVDWVGSAFGDVVVDWVGFADDDWHAFVDGHVDGHLDLSVYWYWYVDWHLNVSWNMDWYWYMNWVLVYWHWYWLWEWDWHWDWSWAA